MAECPGSNCKINWQWDWCQDSYRDAETGEFCKEQEIHNEKGVEVTLFKCSECGIIMSVNVVDPKWGACPFNHQEWAGVDWDHEYNFWPKQ